MAIPRNACAPKNQTGGGVPAKEVIPEELYRWTKTASRFVDALAFCHGPDKGPDPIPQWVRSAARRISRMFVPVAVRYGLGGNGKPSPRLAGALRGHAYAKAGVIHDIFIEVAKKRDESFPIACHSIRLTERAMLDILKSVEDVATWRLPLALEFWRGFVQAMEAGTIKKLTARPVSETRRVNILLTMIEHWRAIEEGRTSDLNWGAADLCDFLTDESGGLFSFKEYRVKKICDDIGLRFRRGKRIKRHHHSQPAA